MIAPKDYVVHPVVRGALQEVDRRASAKKLLEKFIERMDLLLWLSENEVGLVAFPKPDGGFDLSGFTSSDERALAWSRDIFTYYWGIAPEKSDSE